MVGDAGEPSKPWRTRPTYMRSAGEAAAAERAVLSAGIPPEVVSEARGCCPLKNRPNEKSMTMRQTEAAFMFVDIPLE